MKKFILPALGLLALAPSVALAKDAPTNRFEHEGSTYSYTVTASDSCGESDASGAAEATPFDPGIGPFTRGDANGDGTVNISDPSAVLNWLFLGGGDPPCLAAADSNQDGSVNISDPSYTLRWLFLGGADHPAPTTCGNSTDDGDVAQGCDTATCE